MVGRFVDWVLVIASLLGIAAVAWWAIYGGPNSAVNLENMLQKQSNATLQDGGHNWAEVVMDGQHATLTGASPSFDAQEAALQSLGDVNLLRGGVTKVSSEIVSAAPVSPFVWSAEREPDGKIHLSGYVPTTEVRDQLVTRAEEIAPGQVTNEMKVASGAPRGMWKEAALIGLSALSRLDHGKATLNDLGLTLSGQAPDQNTISAVRRAMSAVAEPFTGQESISTGFTWNATLKNDMLVVEGSVRSDADRLAILAAAENSFNGVIEDRMIVEADAVSSWLPAILSALPQFTQFKSGQLSAGHDPALVRVRGQTYGSVEAFLKQDLADSLTPVDIDLEILQVEASELGDIDLSSATPESCQQGFDAVMKSNAVLFESGSANIDRISGQTLDKIMYVAQECNRVNFTVHGHTDAAGDRGSNIALSRARAGAVKAYLVSRGLAENRIDIVGSGPDLPVADNTTRDGRAKNRRIEFKIAEEG